MAARPRVSGFRLYSGALAAEGQLASIPATAAVHGKRHCALATYLVHGSPVYQGGGAPDPVQPQSFRASTYLSRS